MTYSPSTPPTTPSTLGDIVLKIRRITKSPSQNQITDSQIVQYVNSYLLYDWPEVLRLKDLLTNYTFTTVPNVSQYLFDTINYTLVEQPIYINGYQSYFTQSQDNFFLLYPRLGLSNTPVTGNGATAEYTFTLTNTPIFPNQLVISAMDTSGVQMVVTDTLLPVPSPIEPTTQYQNLQLENTLTGDTNGDPLVNTVNYVTSEITVHFSSDVAAGEPVNVQFVPYNPSRPVACLFYNNTFNLRPVPDNSYLVQIQAYVKPVALGGVNLTDATSQNLIQQWWQPIAVGAALKIFEDRGDFDQYQKYFAIYDEYRRLSLRRTLAEQSSERTATIYTEQVQYPIGNFFNQF